MRRRMMVTMGLVGVALTGVTLLQVRGMDGIRSAGQAARTLRREGLCPAGDAAVAFRSGKVEPLDIGLLAAKGSLYVSRPTLFTHIATRESTQAMADDLFAMVSSGKVKIQIDQIYPLEQVQQAHRDLEARKTTGCTVLTL